MLHIVTSRTPLVAHDMNVQNSSTSENFQDEVSLLMCYFKFFGYMRLSDIVPDLREIVFFPKGN